MGTSIHVLQKEYVHNYQKGQTIQTFITWLYQATARKLYLYQILTFNLRTR